MSSRSKKLLLLTLRQSKKTQSNQECTISAFDRRFQTYSHNIPKTDNFNDPVVEALRNDIIFEGINNEAHHENFGSVGECIDVLQQNVLEDVELPFHDTLLESVSQEQITTRTTCDTNVTGLENQDKENFFEAEVTETFNLSNQSLDMRRAESSDNNDDSDYELQENSSDSDVSGEEMTHNSERYRKSEDENELENHMKSVENKERKMSKKRKRKLQKDAGKQYINTREQIIAAKKMKPNPCLNKKCVNECHSFSERDRQAIFDFFWGLKDSTKQKTYLSECITVGQVKRRRMSKNMVNRNFTNEYFLKKNSVRKKVCKQFLINTMAITVRLLRTVISNKDENKFPEVDQRGHHRPYNKVSEQQIEQFKDFINKLPLVPSHYCRSSSSKKYLPADVKSFNNVYRMYQRTIKNPEQGDLMPLKKTKFMQLLKSHFNIGIHVPKKDKCPKCERYKHLPDNLKTAEETETYNLHLQEKEAVKKIFLQEQSLSGEENTVLVASFDLQKVLATPHGDSMTIGFSRKYAVYNFTVYETASRKGYCYLWGEKDGKRGSTEIASNLLKYLTEVDQSNKYNKISLFCDNCSGQNKNRYMLLMLRYFLDSAKNINEITLTYLIVGHTYMPVDSMHAIIEKSIKNKIVQAPSEWPTLLRNARLSPEPYIVKQLHFSDFLDFRTLSTEKSSKIKISAIKRATFFKNDFNVKIQTSFLNPKEESMHFKMKSGCKPRAAYTSEQAITKPKYDNLKTLCQQFIIKPEYHVEYLSLKTSGAVQDRLDETDVEEEPDE